ncbi:MAG TPA: D-alanine--D-alanine ligase family protein [Acidobacteriaceae bacterium]|nr:D-alanine--D-alanine ligase family protein [Acidobacteriaceae bacterium]
MKKSKKSYSPGTKTSPSAVGARGRKLRVGVLFGGRSGEHEVSLLSAASVLSAIDPAKYDVVPIGLDKRGRWLTGAEAGRLLAGATPTLAGAEKARAVGEIAANAPPSQQSPSRAERSTSSGSAPTDAVFAAAAAVLRSGENFEELRIPTAPPMRRATDLLQHAATAELAHPGSPLAASLDVVFPVLHGTFGEDGTVQGLFELADIAYVGSGVLGSSAAMDKDAMKRLFASAGLPQTPHITVLRSQWRAEPKRMRKEIEAALKYPIFVKPANLGSSVGISKVHDRGELAAAMDLAASFDRKIVIEQGVAGQGSDRLRAKPRELEVSVLGNDDPVASVVGEIVPNREFYDYASKYEAAEEPSVPIIPAKLTKAQEKEIRAMAIAAFRACDCAGLARVDFLMEPEDRAKKTSGKKSAKKSPRIFLNEINTMPGFTSISMYPKLWQASGLSYSKLIDRLIELALARHSERQQTRFTRA